MIYFKSRYLAEKLEINLAKWKRWSREFLDPDPLGGYQSGYARQFSFKEAFRVFFGGHLVGALNFTIPQARDIILDLNPWLKKNQLYIWPIPNDTALKKNNRCIYIYEPEPGQYAYAVRAIVLQNNPRTDGRHQEVYALELVGWSWKAYAAGRFTHARVINVDALHHYFLDRVANGKG
jgi:hypothetical protein